MDIFMTILTGLVITFGGPFAVVFGNHYVQAVRKTRALRRLQQDDMVFVGARYAAIRAEGSDVPLIGECEVTKVAYGRVEVRSTGGEVVMGFTGLEFEKLHPMLLISPPSKETGIKKLKPSTKKSNKKKGTVEP